MEKKIAYKKRMEPFCESVEAKKTIRTLMRFNVKDYLEAIADEADAQSETAAANKLRLDLKKLRRLFSDTDECTVCDITRAMPDSPAYSPEEVGIIVESLFIDPFELYRRNNKC
ncbi:MAG: hypothetical protein ACOYJO_02015 [Eubacterium sp.]|jgi:hypothetical protein